VAEGNRTPRLSQNRHAQEISGFACGLPINSSPPGSTKAASADDNRRRSCHFSGSKHPSPELVNKVTALVGLYLHPPEKAVVVCVDENSQVQAPDCPQPLLPMRPGQVERRTNDPVRHGTPTLFAALDVATREVTGRTYALHRHEEFLKFLQLVAKRYPAARCTWFSTTTAPTSILSCRPGYTHPRIHLHSRRPAPAG
jgi:hypothetical protein